MEKQSHKKKEKRQFQLIGSRSLWQIGSMSLLTWQDGLKRTHPRTHTHALETQTRGRALSHSICLLYLLS